MQKRSSNGRRRETGNHVNNKSALKKILVDTQSVGTEVIPSKVKNPAAVMLGRLGGLKGGKARAAKLSEERRREIASKAAQARWNSTSK